MDTLNVAIYKYLLSHNNDSSSLFISAEGYRQPNIDLRKYFGGFFSIGCSLDMLKEKENGECTRYPNKVVAIYDDIILMRVCNEKKVSVVENYVERKETSNPWCYVLIDNRPNKGYIIIEKSASFNSDTDTVRDILTIAFTRMMHKPEKNIDIEIQINAKLREGDFWKFVKERTAMNDTISKCTFEFPIPGKAEMIDATEQELKLISNMLISGLENGVKGAYTVSGDSGHNIQLIERIDDTKTAMAHLTSLCLRHGFELCVSFRNYGDYKYGADTAFNKEILSVPEKYVKQLESDPAMILTPDGTKYDIVNWLDLKEDLVKDLKDEDQTATGYRKSNKR